MNKFIPLSSLKDTTGIVELCKKAGEPLVLCLHNQAVFFIQKIGELYESSRNIC